MAQVVRQIAVPLSMVMLLLTFTVSCVTTGEPNLTKGTVGQIVDGETTRGEIEELLGKPGQVLNLDKESLLTYLKRVSVRETAEISLSEDRYEVWTYSRWNQAAVLVLFPSYEKASACILIINSDGICVKKLYIEENRVAY